MSYFIFVIFHLFLLTEINSSPINEEVIRLEKSPNDFGSIGRILTWKFQVDQSSFDSNRIYQEIQLALDQLESDTDLSFRQVTNDEKADIEVTLLAGNHSHGILLDGSLDSYTAYIRINSIEAWTDTFNDIAEHLRIKLTNAIVSSDDDGDETSMNDIQHSSRIARSARHKKKKNKKKKKCTKYTKAGKKIVGKGCKPIKNTKSEPNTPRTTTEGPPVIFPKEDLDTVNDLIINSKPRNELEDFSKISDMIKNVTGLFPTDSIPILQNLSISYARTTYAIKISFADACSVLTKFVIKAYNLMKRSMNKRDEEVLMKFATTLKNDSLHQFNSFEADSREQLIDIHSKLLIKAHGAKMRALLKQRREKEKEVIEQAGELIVKHTELSAIQADMASLSYEQQFVEKAMEDSERAKNDAQEEIKKLENQIPSYEQKLMDHRNTHTTEYGRFWIFSWRVRDVTHDNGEAFARESLNRLLDRIRTLKDMVNNWSNKKSMERVAVIRHNLTRFSNDSRLKQELYRKHNESYSKIEAEFFKIINEMKNVEETAGTVNLESMDAVDRLARAVQSGQESFVSSYATVRETIKSIDVDRDLMIKSIQSALQFIQMGDDYMKGTRIDDIRRILGIVKQKFNSTNNNLYEE